MAYVELIDRPRKEAVSLERQRILELAGNHETGTRDDPPRGRAIEALEVSNVDGLLAPRPPSRRAVRLERYLHDRRLARASHLGEHANWIGHVLEHVADDAELVLPIARRQVQAVIQGHRVDLRTARCDRDRRTGDLHPRQPPAEAAAVQLAEQRAIPAADLQRARGLDACARAQRRHVVGLGDRAERTPARI